MRLHYYRASRGNFGDDLNQWIWERLMPGLWAEEDGIVFSGIGTILGRSRVAARHRIIFGSGAGYSALTREEPGQTWHVVCVRGPLTADVLHLPASAAVSDGALLLSLLPEYAPLPKRERQGIVFMPHHYQVDCGDWAEACAKAGIEFLSPRGDSREILQRLRRADLILADAMHAAIAADAMRVPWIPVTTSKSTNTFKWLDWTRSMEVPYRPVRIPASTPFEALQEAVLAFIGEDFRLDGATVQAALRHYRSHVRRKGSLSTSVMSYAAKRGIHAVRRLMDGLRGSSPRETISFRLDRTARALVAAARSSSFLSPSEVFLFRRDEMARRLDGAKDLARSLGVQRRDLAPEAAG
jgi:succinoglycan biosynthesis protein ExoV